MGVEENIYQTEERQLAGWKVRQIASQKEYAAAILTAEARAQHGQSIDTPHTFYVIRGRCEMHIQDCLVPLGPKDAIEAYTGEELELEAEPQTKVLVIWAFQKQPPQFPVSLRKNFKSQSIIPLCKMWAGEYRIINNPQAGYCAKMLRVEEKMRSSFHYHKQRHKTLYCESGRMILQDAESEAPLERGDAITIPQNLAHRIIGLERGILIECGTSQHLDEDTFRNDKSGKVHDSEWQRILEKYRNK